MREHYLITGGAGRVGRALIQRLLRDGGCDITVVDRAAPSEVRPGSVHWSQMDVLDPELMEALGTLRPTAIVHLAAAPVNADMQTLHRDNARATLAMLEWARKHGGPAFVLAGGRPLGTGLGKIPEGPTDPLMITKQAAEQFLGVHGRLHHLPVAVVRWPFASDGSVPDAVLEALIATAHLATPGVILTELA